jgi:hypothetical protein
MQSGILQPIARTGHGQTFRFLDLPEDLRNMVYKLCVVVGEVRISRPGQAQSVDMRYGHARGARAEVSLFRVNKQVRRESLPLYLSSNHFVIPAVETSSLEDPEDAETAVTSVIPGCHDYEYHRHLRSVSISLDCRESFRSAMNLCTRKEHTDFHFGHDPLEEVASVLDHHNDIATDLHNYFHYIVTNVIALSDNMRKIQINVQNATCGSGCHRLIPLLFENSMPSSFAVFAETCELESLDFLGTVNEKERRIIRSAVPQPLRRCVTFHGKFDPYEEEWDPKVEILDEPGNEQDMQDVV